MQGRGRGRGGPPFGRGGSFHGDDPRARDKALRSIFVANVAFDTTEEQLGTLLREVGPIVNLKLIYDPGTGKPRGFGFCEYEDAETAMSAVRNLAGRELNGRPLRIDSAANAPNAGGGGPEGGGRGAMNPPMSQSPQQLPPPERQMYGNAVPPENAPEVITKAVASLPPEQMFELMKQMKWFLQQNPQEARQLLLHNPQLAYALLQAQVVMKIVDVEVAHNILHRTSRGPSLAASHSPASSEPPPPPPPQGHQQMRGPPMGGGGGGPPPPPRGGDQFQNQHMGHSRPPHPMQGREDRGRGPPPPDFGPRPTRGGGAPGHFDRGPPNRGSPPRDRPPPPTSHFPPRDHGPAAPSQDQNKAELIMQVLSLTDEQIQMLPPDQRSSILKLKDQIARSR